MTNRMTDRIKKERDSENKTTVALDLGLMTIGTIVRIFEDLQEEIVYQKEENDKLRTVT